MGFSFAFLTHLLLAAQAAAGSITGIVKDAESGAPLAGAIVTLVDLARIVLTDPSGRYDLLDVPAGPQHIVVRRIGYAPRIFHALVPRDGAVEIDVTLRPEPIPLEPIDVQARVPVRGLEDSEGALYPDRGFSTAAVRGHPMLPEPDVLRAAAGGEVIIRPESPSGIHVRGGASDQIAYLLDGIPVFSPYHAAGTFSAWNPDALSRIDLFTASSPAPHPDALSGVVSGITRATGTALVSQGSFSTTQARVMIEGPAGRSGARYLLSLRSAFPGLLLHTRDRSYLRGEGGDWIAKLESPFLGGHLRLLGCGSGTALDAAARSRADSTAIGDPARNSLSWGSRSFGADWARPLAGASLRLRAWSATGEAHAGWRGSDPPEGSQEHLSADRRDAGLAAIASLAGAGTSTEAGVRVEGIRTIYGVRSDAAGGGLLSLDARTPVAAAFIEHRRACPARSEANLFLMGSLAAGDVYLSPAAQLRWQASDALAVSGAYARRHQFVQSLRNPESIIANVFPVDLYAGAGDSGVPVARSDLGIVALEYRPAAGMRIGAQAYARALDGLALVAPQESDPFAVTGFASGTGRARGLAVEAAANGTRYAVIASYGFQRVRYQYGDSSYVPDQGAAHSIETGITIFPSATSSIRLGVTSLLGRRATAFRGPFEWESCNLLDQGCEVSGTPGDRSGPLGGVRLPAYVRLDLGARKHWHLRAGGRDWILAVFASASNLFGRRNVLAVTTDPSTGRRTQIDMLPRSPIVAGMDWQF